MKILDKILRKNYRVIKACQIYKKAGNYKILTQSETKAGFLLSGEPIFIVSTSSPIEVLESALFQALNSSRNNIPIPKREEYLLIQKKIMIKLKEKSYNSLCKNSYSCSLILENNKLTIYPDKFYDPAIPSRGLVYVQEDMIEIEDPENNKREVTLKIAKLLEKDYKGIGQV